MLGVVALILLGLYVTSSEIRWPAPVPLTGRFLGGWLATLGGMLLLILVGRAWGSLLERVLPRLDAASPGETDTLSTAGGLLALSALYTWLAFAALRPIPIVALAIAPLLLGGGRATLQFARRTWAAARSAPAEAAGFLALALFLAFLAARPDASLDGLIYQVALPELYMRHGSYFLLPNNVLAGLPNVGNFLFLPGLALTAWPLAKAVQPAFLLLALAYCRGASVLAWDRRHFWAFVMFLLSIPSLAVNASNLYVDVTLTAALTLCLLSALSYLRSGTPSPLTWAIFFGLGAVAIKWTVAPIVLCLLALLAFVKPRAPVRLTGRLMLTCLAIALFFLAPCLVKNVHFYRSPVFPGLAQLAPASINWSADRQALFTRFLRETFGVGREPLDFLLLPLNLITLAKPDAILPSGHRPFDGLVGIVPTLVGLALLTARGGERYERGLRILLLAGFALWAATSQQVRFLLPLLPMGIAVGLGTLGGGRAPVAIAALLGALGVTQSAALVTDGLGLWARSDDPAHYRYEALGNEGRLYRWMNENLAPSERCLLLGMNAYPTLARNALENDPVFPWYSLEQRLAREGVGDDPFLAILRARRCDVLVVNRELEFRVQGRAFTTASAPFAEILARDFEEAHVEGRYAVLKPRPEG